MKVLQQYSKHKYDYQIIHREGNWAISYGKSRVSRADNWEVFEIQSHNGLTIGGVYMEPAEFVPNNSQWGSKGWTALNEKHAYELLNKHKN